MAQMPAPAVCTTQYSSLQQERMYLLSALAEEEDRGERLTRAFNFLSLKLKKLEDADPPESSPKLKQTIRAIRHKIGTCQQRERALADNLAQVVAHMDGLKRFQWRSAQHNYAQQHQYGQMTVMSPGFPPGFALQSPMNMDLVPDMQYMGLQQPLTARTQQQYQQQFQQPYPMTNAYYPNYMSPTMPATPVIVPHAQYASQIDASSPYAASPAETYTGSEIDELAEAISPCDLTFLGINNLPRRRGHTIDSNPFPEPRESTITVARIPDSDIPSEQTPPSSNKTGTTTRRLSILGATSSGTRQERETAH